MCIPFFIPNDNFVAKNFQEFFFFQFLGAFEMSKMRRKIHSAFAFPLQKRRRPNNIFFPFCLFLTKLLVTGSSKFAQIISSTVPINLSHDFFRNSIFFFYIRFCEACRNRKQIGVVGKAAADHIIEIANSNPPFFASHKTSTFF